MSNNENVVNIDTDVARSKTRNFLRRHKTKFTATALTGLAVTSFVLGRQSKNVVESVDVDVNRPDDTTKD